MEIKEEINKMYQMMKGIYSAVVMRKKKEKHN